MSGSSVDESQSSDESSSLDESELSSDESCACDESRVSRVVGTGSGKIVGDVMSQSRHYLLDVRQFS